MYTHLRKRNAAGIVSSKPAVTCYHVCLCAMSSLAVFEATLNPLDDAHGDVVASGPTAKRLKGPTWRHRMVSESCLSHLVDLTAMLC